MSEADVETIRAGLEALNRRDIEAMLATLHPDAELLPARAVLEGTSYRGHAGLREWLADMAEDWDEFRIDIDEIRAVRDGRVLVLARFHARGKSSGVKLDQPAAWICRMDDGKATYVKFYTDAAAALAAAAG